MVWNSANGEQNKNRGHLGGGCSTYLITYVCIYIYIYIYIYIQVDPHDFALHADRYACETTHPLAFEFYIFLLIDLYHSCLEFRDCSFWSSDKTRFPKWWPSTCPSTSFRILVEELTVQAWPSSIRLGRFHWEAERTNPAQTLLVMIPLRGKHHCETISGGMWCHQLPNPSDSGSLPCNWASHMSMELGVTT